MVIVRIAVLGGLGLMLGGCLSLTDAPRAYSALQPPAVSDSPLPPVVVPGQVLTAGLGATGTGVNPSDELTTSQRQRSAWEALHPSELAQPPSFASHTASANGATDPISTASVSKPAKVRARRDADPQSYDREATMDRLVKEGRKDAKPICGGC